MKFALVAAVLAFGPLTFAGTAPIQNSTCRIYLPINNQITSWSTSQEVFISKGYTPIERAETDPTPLVANELAAAIHINAVSPDGLFSRNRCTVNLEVDEFLSDSSVATRFIAKAQQKSSGSTAQCTNALNDVLKQLPSCEKTSK